MPTSLEVQPISHVVWMRWEDLIANDYNPNSVAPMELDLLRTSLKLCGWTQPIVIREDNTIVDGFHRWTIAQEPEMFQLTGGMVPTVLFQANGDRAEDMAATIAHNRARGTHSVTPMSNIIRKLKDEFLKSEEWIGQFLGMEEEEIVRLYDCAGSPERNGDDEFKKGWISEDDVEKHNTTHE